MAKDGTHDSGNNHQGILRRYFPILDWLPKYQLSWLRADIVAGLTVWAILVPEAMAYAGIANVPPIVGLYTLPLPLIAYAIFGTSRTMVIGPDSATALISGVTVGAVVAMGSTQFVAVTSAVAMMVGVFFLIFGLLRMGWVANFIPEPAMKGFIQGLVWVTIIGQVPKVFGIEGGHGNFFQKTWDIIENVPDAHVTTTVVGLGSLVLLFALKRFLPKVPTALTVVAVGVVVVTILDLDQQGVEIVGDLKAGLPHFGVPDVSLEQIAAIIPGALAIVLLGYAESLGAAKAAAAKLGGKIDPNQELVSHGPANLGAAFSGGFLVVGSLSKTSVAMGAGGKTQLSMLVSTLFVVLTLLFLMPLFKNLPHATLGAIVIEAMLGLADFDYLKRLQKISGLEFSVAMAALFGVLILGVLPGIGLGVVLALVLLIYRASYPGTAELGQLPGQDAYRDITRRPDAATIPGLLIYRFDSALVFINANHFADEAKRLIAASKTPIRQLLVDCETMNLLDTTGAAALVELCEELRGKDIGLSLARVRDPVRERMRRIGLESTIGEDHIFETINDGVTTFKDA